MTQYRGQHQVVAARGRHRAPLPPRIPGPAFVAASGALAAAAVVAAAVAGNDAPDVLAHQPAGGGKPPTATAPTQAGPEASGTNPLFAFTAFQHSGGGRTLCFGCQDTVGQAPMPQPGRPAAAPGGRPLRAEVPISPSASALWTSATEPARPSSGPRAAGPSAVAAVPSPATATAARITGHPAAAGPASREHQDNRQAAHAPGPRLEPTPHLSGPPASRPAGDSARKAGSDQSAAERPGGRHRADPAAHPAVAPAGAPAADTAPGRHRGGAPGSVAGRHRADQSSPAPGEKRGVGGHTP